MILKGILDEDFINYSAGSLFLAFPTCTWKCEKDCGKCICQNSSLAKEKDIEITAEKLVERYIDNPLTNAVVCGGLEPLDSFFDLIEFITKLREKTNDTVVIYTGYKEDEVADKIEALKKFGNIIVKFGRFVPDQERHFDEVLGIYLASDNQYAKKIS